MMKNSIESELKKLQTQRNKLLLQMEDIKRQKASLSEESVFINNQIQKLDRDIKKLQDSKTDELIVSEHAMLRYIERVIGIPLDDIKAKIATSSVINVAKTLGNGTYPVDGFKVKVIDNVVVTVISDDEDDHKRAG